ncbi:MAG TPA: MFS transporter [Syntrophorhabdaceae bacterium]|nr:MFS transporter [Syntrophorhabdaceae bacterium]
MNKKNVFYWVLYDFANSVSFVAFYLYFSQWLVVERGLSDFRFNMIFVGSSALLTLTAPVLGSMADRRGLRLTYLKRVTVMTYICYLAASIVPFIVKTTLWPAVLCFLMVNYFYLLSLVFYTPLLSDISPPQRRGYVSGLGQFGNWIGQVAGLIICLPLVKGMVLLPGPPGRVQAFLPATLAYIALSLPMILLFRAPERHLTVKAARTTGLQEMQEFAENCRGLLKVPGIVLFLLSYFLFADALLTISINFPIFLQQVWSLPDSIKSSILLMILVCSALGSVLSGWASDRLGLKPTLVFLLLGFCVLLPVIAMQRNFVSFNIAVAVLSVFFGSVFAVTRALLTRLCPNEKLNFASSFYVLFERFATFIGPMAWGAIVSGMADSGPVRYRWAFGAMAVFVMISVALALKIPKRNEEGTARTALDYIKE